MEFGFLFWLFLGGIIVASLTDLKRREVDNWWNLFLIFFSLVFVFYGSFLSGEFDVILHVGFFLVFMFVVMNLFYYGHVFAGGDAKLLFAMSLVFLGSGFLDSMINVGIFLLFLMISGSVYGLCYSGVLWAKNWDEVNGEMKKVFVEKKWLVLVLFGGIVFMLLGFYDFLFLLTGICFVVFPFLFVFAKGLENVSMVREISGDKLREGDWLVKDVRVGRKVVRANWDGISLEEIRLLKGKKKILIKEGLPFVPAFLIGFLVYWFLKDWFLRLLMG